ncbi:hypothetical protein WT08_20395 [Burkholderia sp. MSMB1552]|nr:hypothetical protein WT08_20395 [Burkholderia sp. MSMB1552]
MNALSSTLASFDPATKRFKLYPLGHSHLYPHTIRIDRAGIVWFTIVASNEVARFDPKTGTFTIIHLPDGGFWRAVSHYLFPLVVKMAAWFPGQNLQLALTHHKWAFQGRDAFPYGIAGGRAGSHASRAHRQSPALRDRVRDRGRRVHARVVRRDVDRRDARRAAVRAACVSLNAAG